MTNQGNKKIKNYVFLSHHELSDPFFEYHVFIIKGFAICIGCLAQYLSFAFIVILYLLFKEGFNTLFSIFPVWMALIILLACPNLLIYVYRFIKKTEFTSKIIKFFARFLLIIGFFFDITGMIVYFYIIPGIILIIAVGIAFFLLRKFSDNYIMQIYEDEHPDFYKELPK